MDQTFEEGLLKNLFSNLVPFWAFYEVLHEFEPYRPLVLVGNKTIDCRTNELITTSKKKLLFKSL